MIQAILELALGGLFLASLPTYAHFAPCEDRLAPAQRYEYLVNEAAELEVELAALESVCRGGRCLRDAQDLRAKFTEFVEDLLDQRFGPVETAENFARLVRHAQLLRTQAAPLKPPTAVHLTLLDYLLSPKSLPAETMIEINNSASYIHTVAFDSETLKEFSELDVHRKMRFLRAIYAGLVGPKGESGIKILGFIAKNLIEVKAFGSTRFFGCLEDGNLRVLRVSHETSHNRALLYKYSRLCE